MQRVRFFLNNQETENYPLDIEEMKIVVDWERGKGRPEIDFSSLRFRGADAQTVFNRELSQLGFYNGVPFRIEALDYNGQNTVVFDGFLDLAKTPPKFIGCNEVEVAVTSLNSASWFDTQKNTIPFTFLQKERGTITNADFVQVPYIINYIPDVVQITLMGISTYLMVKQLTEVVRDIATVIADTTMASVPNTGISAAGPVIVANIGAIIAAALKIAAILAYNIALVIAIKNLIQQIFEQLIPLVRYHTGIKMKTLMEKGCQELGLNFESTIFDGIWGDAVYIPTKAEKGKLFQANFGQGLPELNDFGYFFGNMFDAFKEMFNADYRIENGNTLRFERWDYWRNNQGNYVFPSNYNLQEVQKVEKVPNTNELLSGYFVAFDIDTQDQNTLDNFFGTNYDAITYLKTELNGYRNLFGNREVRMPFALGTRKNKLTRFEEFFKDLAGAVDFVTGLLGNGTSFKAKIENRVGALYLSEHTTSKPKIVLMSGSTVSPQNREIVSAKHLYHKYHFINSFVPINGIHNQHWQFFDVPDRFCYEDFINLLNNNYGTTQDGDDAEAMRLEWEIIKDEAVIDFRVNTLYDNNLRIRYEQGGEGSQGTVE